jgi:hypothetical protein
MPGQPFSGQLGQGFAGLWHGMSPIAEESATAVPVTASALVELNGVTTSAPSMAIMPRAATQRWKKCFLTEPDCHGRHHSARRGA